MRVPVAPQPVKRPPQASGKLPRERWHGLGHRHRRRQYLYRRQALEVDHRSCQICLDGNIAQSATYRTTQTVLSLCFAMHSFDSPAVSFIYRNKVLVRLAMASSCS